MEGTRCLSVSYFDRGSRKNLREFGRRRLIDRSDGYYCSSFNQRSQKNLTQPNWTEPMFRANHRKIAHRTNENEDPIQYSRNI
jgi:hypothetical protein